MHDSPVYRTKPVGSTRWVLLVPQKPGLLADVEQTILAVGMGLRPTNRDENPTRVPYVFSIDWSRFSTVQPPFEAAPRSTTETAQTSIANKRPPAGRRQVFKQRDGCSARGYPLSV